MSATAFSSKWTDEMSLAWRALNFLNRFARPKTKLQTGVRSSARVFNTSKLYHPVLIGFDACMDSPLAE
jgi:hypothetical protein